MEAEAPHTFLFADLAGFTALTFAMVTIAHRSHWLRPKPGGPTGPEGR